MICTKAKILRQKKIAPLHYKISFISKKIAQFSQPGQFLNVKINEEIFLRRPFAIHRLFPKSGIIEIIYKLVGRGTEILSKKKAGEYLGILGPLGNGFKINNNSGKIILIGGGYGISPLFYLAENSIIRKLLEAEKIIVLIGAKTKKAILCQKGLKKLRVQLKIATEDGSYGYKGLVTDLFNSQLHIPHSTFHTPHSQLSTVYACGPYFMLKETAKICQKNNILCYVSLESRMACGFGACLGCAVKVKDNKYKLVCKDGPVFNAEEIIWD